MAISREIPLNFVALLRRVDPNFFEFMPKSAVVPAVDNPLFLRDSIPLLSQISINDGFKFSRPCTCKDSLSVKECNK